MSHYRKKRYTWTDKRFPSHRLKQFKYLFRHDRMDSKESVIKKWKNVFSNTQHFSGHATKKLKQRCSGKLTPKIELKYFSVVPFFQPESRLNLRVFYAQNINDLSIYILRWSAFRRRRISENHKYLTKNENLTQTMIFCRWGFELSRSVRCWNSLTESLVRCPFKCDRMVNYLPLQRCWWTCKMKLFFYAI